MLNGEDDDAKFIIPFRNIASIAPRSSDRATVTLTSGDNVVLEDAQDVSERNQGVVVKTGGSDRVYIPWDRIEKIDLKQ